MSFIVRRAGGGTFNPNAMVISPDERFVFIACSNNIHIMTVPDLQLVDTIASHQAKISAMATTSTALITADESGSLLFHNYNELAIIDKTPSESHTFQFPVERIIVRSDRVFIIYYKQRLFHVEELNKLNSLLVISQEEQLKLCDLQTFQEMEEPQPIRFPGLDTFDIDNSCNKIIVGDGCKLHVRNLVTGKQFDMALPKPIRICRFRKHDYLVFLANGQLFISGEDRPQIRDHWHFACPNSVVFTDKVVYSGGFEGVLCKFNNLTLRHDFLPRLGLTIEGMAISNSANYIVAVVDKNMLACLDPSSSFVRSSVSNIVGDIQYYKGMAVALRKPNLMQFFDLRDGKCIEKFQVSSYNSTIPVTEFSVGDDFIVTVEVSGAPKPPALSIPYQVDFNHINPKANAEVREKEYTKLLKRARYGESKTIKTMSYFAPDSTTAATEEEVNDKATNREGNPIMHDESSNAVRYSEVKIFTRGEKGFEISQSFRVVGKEVSCLSLHGHMFGMVVEDRLQIWRLSDVWTLFKETMVLPSIKKLVFSEDATVLVQVFEKKIVIFDIENFKEITNFSVGSLIVDLRFISEFEIAILTKVGISIFDLRCLQITNRIFAEAACFDTYAKSMVFVINRKQPVVVLNFNGEMKSWQLPTLNMVKSAHFCEERRVVVIDDENYVWSIDELGIENKGYVLGGVHRSIIRSNIKSEVKELKENRVKLISSLFDFPSHMIPRVDELCVSLFENIMQKGSGKVKKDNTISVKVDDVDQKEAIEFEVFSQKELSEMRRLIIQ